VRAVPQRDADPGQEPRGLALRSQTRVLVQQQAAALIVACRVHDRHGAL
jgi:hypothetical protein